MLKDSDLIIFSLSRWDAPYSSPSFSLAKEFAKNNRVFYIDHPFSIKDFIRNYNTSAVQSRKKALLHGKNIYTKSDKFPENLTMVTPRITLPINFLPEGGLYDRLSRVNDKIVFDAIRQIIRDFDVKKFIFFNAFDPYFCRDFPADIKPIKKVYQSMDDLTQVAYTAKHGTRLEADIIRKFDITLTTSRELRRLKLQHSDQVYLHPNAADFSSFQRALSEKFPRPAELIPAEGKKIIGYTGNIESRIDYQLLKAIIEYHPDKIIAMVGPVTTPEHKTIGLTEYPNVIMTGSKKIDQLPNYLQYFDCALIPFKKNTLTRSIYPLKINEYLAAGRPVVATDFSEDIQSFKDVIYIGHDHAEFVQLIDQAINENSSDKIKARTAVANTNTWTARVEQFWDIVENQKAAPAVVTSAQ
jgi:glycosyltransferase involved in cell wall biosynthesis